jgi:hypothetical protein
MNERETFKFEHRGCTLIATATKLDKLWRCHCTLTFPVEAHQPTAWVQEAPYASAEEAFEKAKQWALREIRRRMPA